MEENLNAKISFSFLSIYEKNVTCKRDPEAQDRDETQTFDFQSETRPRPRRSHISPRPSRDRDVETETTSLRMVSGKLFPFIIYYSSKALSFI